MQQLAELFKRWHDDTSDMVMPSAFLGPVFSDFIPFNGASENMLSVSRGVMDGAGEMELSVDKTGSWTAATSVEGVGSASVSLDGQFDCSLELERELGSSPLGLMKVEGSVAPSGDIGFGLKAGTLAARIDTNIREKEAPLAASLSTVFPLSDSLKLRFGANTMTDSPNVMCSGMAQNTENKWHVAGQVATAPEEDGLQSALGLQFCPLGGENRISLGAQFFADKTYLGYASYTHSLGDWLFPTRLRVGCNSARGLGAMVSMDMLDYSVALAAHKDVTEPVAFGLSVSL